MRIGLKTILTWETIHLVPMSLPLSVISVLKEPVALPRSLQLLLTHPILHTPEGSPHTGDDEDADKPASEEGATDDNLEAEEEAPSGDIIIEEEYYKQQEEEELDYEDDTLVKECEQVVEVNE